MFYVILDTLLSLYTAVVIARVILEALSGLSKPVGPHLLHRFMGIIYWLTEPLLAPLRRVIPSVGSFDFSPMALIVLLILLRTLLAL